LLDAISDVEILFITLKRVEGMYRPYTRIRLNWLHSLNAVEEIYDFEVFGIGSDGRIEHLSEQT
jgi:hypothetical protein